MTQILPCNVVFTGPAFDLFSQPVLRDDLKKHAERYGFKVQSSVSRTTKLVVASRTDTVKAARALLDGLQVVSYPAFIRALGGSVPSSGGVFDRIVDLPLTPEVEKVAGEIEYI